MEVNQLLLPLLRQRCLLQLVILQLLIARVQLCQLCSVKRGCGNFCASICRLLAKLCIPALKTQHLLSKIRQLLRRRSALEAIHLLLEIGHLLLLAGILDCLVVPLQPCDTPPQLGQLCLQLLAVDFSLQTRKVVLLPGKQKLLLLKFGLLHPQLLLFGCLLQLLVLRAQAGRLVLDLRNAALSGRGRRGGVEKRGGAQPSQFQGRTERRGRCSHQVALAEGAVGHFE
mmetsp:Transcript_48937/g.88000  ORF Transcript_48937/g.88000 Transcript_48937/m.88000 type:complete len:228 (-) Transcript_48937:379-1062(-)